MPQLDIRLLGPPEIELNGQPIQVDTRKAVALLAYLAVSGEQQRRDSLAAFFWPESDQTRARAALRRTLSSLSTALDGNWLLVTRETIGLKREPGYWLDLDEFHDRLESARAVEGDALDDLTRAARLYRSHFMDGFNLRDSPTFDNWHYLQSDAAQRELAAVLERLTSAYVEAGDWIVAIDHATRWLRLDPLRESAHRQLMRIHALAGDRAAAIQQYRDCVQILDQELGVGPLEETTELYQSIVEGRFRPLQPPPPATPPGVIGTRVTPVTIPLVGRNTERAALLAAYESIEHAGRLIVLEGEAGIGKTRLAGELLGYAQTRDAAVISSVCYAGESNLAYGVVAGILRSSLGLPNTDGSLRDLEPYARAELARILPQLAGGGALSPPLESPGALDRFYDAIVQFIVSMSRPESPLVLFVDDVQWADDASLNVLSYLVRRLHRSPVCVLLTWRSEDIPREHQLRQLLARTVREDRGTPIPLGPLAEVDILTLVEQVTTRVDEDLGRSLYRESEGVPFFAVEYLARLGQDWETDERDWPMPGSVRDLIRSRLQTVGETGQQLLTTAAVIGRSFDFDLLREASGRSESEAIETLDRLLAQGLVRDAGSSRQAVPTYDFSHEKVRALLYEETSLARRRLVHRRIANALDLRIGRSGGANDLAGQIAEHLRLAGMEFEAAEFYRQAGDRARSLYGNAEALNHYRTALALGYPDPAYLHEALGDLETLEGRYTDALQSYQTAAAHSEPAHLPVIESKLGAVHHRLGEWKIASRHFETAFSAFGVERHAERARALADWSLAAHQSGDVSRALELGHRALELAKASEDNRTLAQTYNQLGILARHQGNATQTARHLEQSLKFANAMEDPGARIAALNNLALVCADQQEFERAITLTEEALAHCRSIGDRHREAALLNNLADFCHMTDDTERSMAYLKEAVAIFAEIGERTDTIRPEIWKLVEW